MPDQTPAETPEQWGSVGGQIAAGMIDTIVQTDLAKFLGSNATDILTVVLATLFKLGAPIGTGFAKGIAAAEDIVAPELAEIAAAAVSDTFGTDIPASAFRQKRNRSGRNQAADQLGGAIINTIKGAGGPLEPSDAAAKRYLTMVTNMTLEGWYQGFIFEFMSSLVPWVDIGKIESFAGLDDSIANMLGLGRVTRSVLRPLVDATVVTPLRWHANKTYRPELLSPAEAVRQVLRGTWTREQGVEELARQGYRDDRIDALFNAQRKFFGPSDVRRFVERNHWSQETAIKHLRDQGYDEPSAQDAIRLAGLARFDQLEAQEAGIIIGAYASRDIDSLTFRGLLSRAVSVETERNLYVELAELRRTLNIKRLTLSQVEAMVRSGVLSVFDYRGTAEREGYPPEDVIALELQLRFELDRAKAIEDHRRELLEQRAAEKAAREAALAVRRAQIEAERALARRGGESDLERAVIRGQIPIARLEELYRARYDPDTVQILIGLVEADRVEYLERLEAAAEARQRGARRNVDAGAIERAFMASLLTAPEFTRRLRELGYDEGDADLLTRVVVARKAELDAAERTRAAAAAAAKVRSIDLGRFEQLVRRGARTFAQYDALLESLGFAAPARADMRDLLQIRIDDDGAARAARAAAEPLLQQRGLSLEQIRRGVLLGVVTTDAFERFLIDQNFSADARLVLLAELAADVAEAEAARARRNRPAPDRATPGLPLSIVRRAAQQGLITVQAYAERLEKIGYSADDIDLEIDLLLIELEEAARERERRERVPPAPASPGPTLAELERAVRAGVATIDAYVARAIALGRTSDDARMIGQVLELELGTLTAARKRHAEIEFELAGAGVSLKDLEGLVTGGEITLDAYVAELVRLEYAEAEAELLAQLLALELARAADKKGSG